MKLKHVVVALMGVGLLAGCAAQSATQTVSCDKNW